MGDAAAPAPRPRLELVGREAELARTEAFLAAVPHGALALVVRGEIGIGKTALWRAAVASARRSGYETLVARPAEEELSLALGGLVDLLDDVVDVDAFRAVDDPVARGRDVLGALRELAGRRPVLVAIDDLQWLDAVSARALRYALRRLDEEPVGLLATARPSERVDPLGAAALLPPGRCETLELGPLGLDGLRRLLAGTVATISRPALRRIHEVSHGNPLFALELARQLDAEGRRELHVDVALPLPESVKDVILRRLDAVPRELVPLLEIASALGRTSLRELRDAVPGSDLDALLTAAEREGLLAVDEQLEVRFAHPLVGSAVRARMSPVQRRALHARLAELVTEPDLRARHLALSTDEPDAAVAELLAAAADRARARSAFDVAADFAGHSRRLTSPDDVEARRRRALVEISSLAAAGAMSRALVLADELIAALPPGRGRAEALVECAQLEDDDLERGEALLARALEDAGEDASLRGRVLDQLGWLRGVFRGDLRAGIECAREAFAIAEASDDAQFRMSAAAGLSNMETLAGSPRPELMATAVAIEEEVGRPPLWSGPRVLLGEQLLWAGNLPAARAVLEAADAEAARSANERWRPYGLYDLAAVECAAGNLRLADELLHRAMEAARDAEDAHVESWIFYRLALVATWLGRADEARAAAARRLEVAGRRGERPGIARARSVLGLLALSEGDVAAGAGELTASAELLDELGFAHPGAIPALPDAVEALALAGDVERARAFQGRLEAQSATVGSAWVLAAVERGRGTVLLADGRAEAAARQLGDAARSFTRLGFLPDTARSLLLAGQALRRAGRRNAAADALADARARFAAMGAALWEARAAAELERVAPGRSAGELTPTESRIAELVADGRKNREIGQTLFMSVPTVEAHLTRVYRKLGIRSRSELTRLVTEGTVALAPRRGERLARPPRDV